MGDRANIVVADDYEADRFVYLYSHWGGYEMPETLREALALPQARGRWDDDPYLARIIFCHMVKGDEDGETGYGISTRPPDNEYPFLVVWRKAVYVVPQNVDVTTETLQAMEGIPFGDYIAQPQDWDRLS